MFPRALIALVLTVAALCAQPLTIEIPIFSGAYGTKFYEDAAREFEQLRPEVKVNLYGDPRIQDRLRVRMIEGNYPDAAAVGEILWPTLIDAGKILDLTPHLTGKNWEQDAVWSNTFLPGALESWRIKGGTYALPFSYVCWSIFYDRAAFRAQGWSEPRTWDEFFQLCEKIRASGRAPLSIPGIYLRYVDAFLRAAHYNLVGAEGWRDYLDLKPGARTDPRFVRAVEILAKLRPYLVAGWEGMSATAAQRAMLEGRAAMTISGSWFVTEMKKVMPPNFELGTMPFPIFADGVGEPTALQTGSDFFFVFKSGDAAREQATIAFLKFLTSRAKALDWVRQSDSPVAVRGVPIEAFSEPMRDTARMIERCRAAVNVPPNMLQPRGVFQTLTDVRWALMNGEITPQQFAESLEQAAETERLRRAHPEQIQARHTGKALALTFGVLSVFLFIVHGAWKNRIRLGNRAASDFGPLGKSMGLGFVVPTWILYLAFVLAPAACAFIWAGLHWDGLGEQRWAGTFNFKWLLLESDGFWTALGNNAYLMLVPALVVVPVSLVLAAMIHRGVWGAGVFRAVVLFPNMLGGIAATLLWMTAYEPHGGLVNSVLVAFGDGLAWLGAPSGVVVWLKSFQGFAWLSPSHLYAALVPIYLWMACGFNLVLYLAAMEGIPTDLYEAAEIEGMPKWRQFFAITLPLIREVLVVSAVFLVIGGLNAFEMIWLLTSQDPTGTTHTLGTLMVTTMFKEFEIGRATAIAVVMFILVLAGSALIWRTLRREVVER